ncbi:DUF1190 domain-containing protein [Devosia psychrophila]|jgi:uncharacterized protein YgiB involved in biofilm formation|uniref:Membrane protein n=1 Tax=Devosia psychrophila TaxID=728005 RepID=A0A0F5PZM3_9HYPH|nr:DUF1190 domain-containing protein [Devosia psychrophila]KKC34088.1 membrane protein [Devosia psychrophila]SFD30133.1 Uncharacterized conserved protein YgiB, involved in bioifilm formation, UPF0441/DUF1190 family [Devosia psychrophila]
MRRRFIGGRSPLLALGTIAASSLALAGCAGEAPAEVMFTTAEQCIQAGMDQQVCQTGYQDAVQAHLTNAPRFDGLAACEAEYGEGQCTAAPAQADGGGGTGFFMPFLAGYMMSSALNNMGAYNNYRRDRELNGYANGASPIYRNRSGQTLTPTVGRPNGTAIVPNRATMQPVNVNTQTVARQGFGGRSTGMGFGG